MTKIKICGLRRMEDILAANQAGPDYVGFVFAPGSKRFVTEEQARVLSAWLHPQICPVGVFVDAPEEQILSLAARGVIRGIQLHGHERMETVQRLSDKLVSMGLRGRPDRPGCFVMKALPMTPDTPLDDWQHSAADFLLLDAASGGTGSCFDHSLIPAGMDRGKPWFLAGGMGPDNAREAIQTFHPYAIDASSSLERNGVKDLEKMIAMVEAVRTV